MTKNKSKQIKKAKYLLLLPLLASMLIYTSCEKNQVEEVLEESVLVKKELQTRYAEFRGEVKKSLGEKETYTDSYMGTDGIPEGKVVEYKNLSKEEKKEYDKFKSILKLNEKYGEVLSLKLYRKNNGRVTIASLVDFSKMKSILNNKINNDDSFPTALVDKLPVFMINEVAINGGSSNKSTSSFQMNIKKYVVRNFNVALSKDLGLSTGIKKIWTVFTVDKNGDIIDIKVRAPHPILKAEVERVVKSLPKMKPAIKDGKAVSMKYTLPISFKVE